MKKALLIVSLLAAVLFAANSAQAYAIYSHVDHEICVCTEASAFFAECKFTIPPNGTHNGEHGSGLKKHAMIWTTPKSCRCVAVFNIPDGGYARVYDDVVKVYKHDNNQVDAHSVYNCDCWSGPGGKKKQP